MRFRSSWWNSYFINRRHFCGKIKKDEDGRIKQLIDGGWFIYPPKRLWGNKPVVYDMGPYATTTATPTSLQNIIQVEWSTLRLLQPLQLVQCDQIFAEHTL